MHFDRNITSPFRVSSTVAVTRSVNNMVRSSTINGYNAVGIVRSAVTYVPLTFRDTARAGSDPRAEDAATLSQYGSNPLRYTDEVAGERPGHRGIGGLRGVLSLPAGFSLDPDLGANYERRNYGATSRARSTRGATRDGNAIASGSEFGNLLSENLLRWNRELGRRTARRARRLHVPAGPLDVELAGGADVPDDILRGNVLQNGTSPQRAAVGAVHGELASWLGRVNYSLFDRYLFTATVRADGSSKFAANNKWATFPAFACAWKASTSRSCGTSASSRTSSSASATASRATRRSAPTSRCRPSPA
jgi:hypothetical protein